MNRFMSLFKKKRLLIPLVFTLLLAGTNSCMSLRMDDKAVVKSFKKSQLTAKIYHTKFQGKTMRYIASKPIDAQLPTLFFIHGAPGSATNFLKYMQDSVLNSEANLIAVDRLGYGFSDFGQAETAITAQAESILNILSKNQLHHVILVGWSYGGTIAAKMVMLHPEMVKHVVLIAPAISPKDEKYFALGKLADWKLTRWMVPKVFKVAEAEKLSHVKELEFMLPDWSKIKTPITYYHGDNDHIVPYENANFIKREMSADYLNLITIKGGSHFIAFKNFDLIKAELLRMLNDF